MIALAYLVCVFLIYVSFVISQELSELDFIIKSPNDGDIYVIKPTDNSMDLTIKYSFDEKINTISNICFQINSESNNTLSELLKETCIPPTRQSVTINNIPPNKYRLSTYAIGQNETEVGPMIQKSFQVHSMLEFIPNLKILNEQLLFFNEKEDADEVSATIFYSITANTMSPSNFLLCCQLVSLPANINMTDINCFETSQSSLSMNLPISTYQLQFFYQDKLTQTYLPSIEQGRILVDFQVVSFQANFPRFKVLQNQYELVVNETTQTTDILIPYSFEASISNTIATSSFSNIGDVVINTKLEICIEIINMNTSQFFLPLTCLVPSVTPAVTSVSTTTDNDSNNSNNNNNSNNRFKVITLQGIPAGQYQANLILRNRQNPDIMYFPSLQVIDIDAKPRMDFEPTFDWQIVKNWHIVPIGLEFRNVTKANDNGVDGDDSSGSFGSTSSSFNSNISGNVQIEARIPECYSCIKDQL